MGVGRGKRCPLPIGEGSDARIFFDFGSQNGDFRCTLGIIFFTIQLFGLNAKRSAFKVVYLRPRRRGSGWNYVPVLGRDQKTRMIGYLGAAKFHDTFSRCRLAYDGHRSTATAPRYTRIASRVSN